MGSICVRKMGKKIKVLALSTIFYPHYGGAEKAIAEIYNRQSPNIIVKLLTPNFGPIKHKFNFKVKQICKLTQNKYWKAIKYQFFMIYHGLQEDFDIIHSHYTFSAGIAGLVLKFLKKKPLVITEHHFGTGMDIVNEKQNPLGVNFIMQLILKRADKIITTGATQSNFVRRLGIKNFEVVHLGGDVEISSKSKTDLRKKHALRPNDFIMFSVSRLVKRKRYDIILNAAKKLTHVQFIIGGKGPEFENLLNKKIKENIHNVKLIGFVSDEALKEWYKLSDAFISSSEFEGAGIIYFEAFAAKLPLFAKSNEASREAINHLKNGILFEDENELVNKISQIKNNKLTEVSLKGYKKYKEKYNWRSCAKRYSQIFKELYTPQ